MRFNDDVDWTGISVTGEDTDYSGAVREFPQDGEAQDHYYADFPFDVYLWKYLYGDKQPTVTVNGTLLNSNEYELSTDGKVLLLETKEAVGPQKYDDTHVILTLAGFSHYLKGNGINYMFDVPVSYDWTIKRLMRDIYAYGIETMNRKDVLNANINVIPIAMIRTPAQNESMTITDVLTSLIEVKEVSQLTAPVMGESMHITDALTATIDVILTGSSPI